jgi:hypothetical protein
MKYGFDGEGHCAGSGDKHAAGSAADADPPIKLNPAAAAPTRQAAVKDRLRPSPKIDRAMLCHPPDAIESVAPRRRKAFLRGSR